MFVISPPALRKIAQGELDVAVPKLEVSDDRGDYGTSEGDGLWIRPFLEFIEEKVAERAHVSGFTFSLSERLDEDLLDEIESTHVRALMIEFINAHYEQWRDDDIDLPDYDNLHSDCRDYCDSCDSGWNEVHGEYDGPHEDDVDADENESELGISEEERQARHRRNLERRSERARRRAAQQEAEDEVIEREFACDCDCDGFMDHVDDVYRDAFEANIDALKRRWKEFLADRGEKDFPPLHSHS